MGAQTHWIPLNTVLSAQQCLQHAGPRGDSDKEDLGLATEKISRDEGLEDKTTQSNNKHPGWR